MTCDAVPDSDCVFLEATGPDIVYLRKADGASTNLLMNYTISEDGLLIGWKFYCDFIKPAWSVASVWREVETLKYSLVGKTFLQCEVEGVTTVYDNVTFTVSRADVGSVVLLYDFKFLNIQRESLNF